MSPSDCGPVGVALGLGCSEEAVGRTAAKLQLAPRNSANTKTKNTSSLVDRISALLQPTRAIRHLSGIDCNLKRACSSLVESKEKAGHCCPALTNQRREEVSPSADPVRASV